MSPLELPMAPAAPEQDGARACARAPLPGRGDGLRRVREDGRAGGRRAGRRERRPGVVRGGDALRRRRCARRAHHGRRQPRRVPRPAGGAPRGRGGPGAVLAPRPARRIDDRRGRPAAPRRRVVARLRPAGGVRAAVSALDGGRRLADRARRRRCAATQDPRHERADGARRGRRGRHRRLRRGGVGAGAVRRRHRAGEPRARSQPAVGRVADGARARTGARRLRRRRAARRRRRGDGRHARQRPARRAARARRRGDGGCVQRRPGADHRRVGARRQAARRRRVRRHAQRPRRAHGPRHPTARPTRRSRASPRWSRPRRRAGHRPSGSSIASRASTRRSSSPRRWRSRRCRSPSAATSTPGPTAVSRC